jgi:hypothetical protein
VRFPGDPMPAAQLPTSSAGGAYFTMAVIWYFVPRGFPFFGFAKALVRSTVNKIVDQHLLAFIPQSISRA